MNLFFLHPLLFGLVSVNCYTPRANPFSESTFVPFVSKPYKARRAVKAADIMWHRLSQPAAELEMCWIYLWVGRLGLSRHTQLLMTERERWGPEVSEVMLADTICSSLLILADMRHHRRAERQMARQGAKLCLSANCFLTLFRVCVYRHSAGVVRSSQNEARAMTKSGVHATTSPHTQLRERKATSDPPQCECSFKKPRFLCYLGSARWLKLCIWNLVRCNLYLKNESS